LKECETEGCGRPRKSRGLCNTHYEYRRRHGGFDDLNILCSTPADALRARSRPEGDCILWTGSLNDSGYGTMRAHGATHLAHRVGWVEAGRELPAGAVLDHTCPNRNCISIEHLRRATVAENSRARVALNSNNTSGYRNVAWDKQAGSWAVKVGHRTVGRYGLLEDAVLAASAAREEMYGEFAGRG